ncbi:Drug/metabolite transporter [Corchorus olitorius]|uniref:WAT1-related protein n=1 Tax=Corchorus olitorius TaxID=93759 RepID=A0A1R3KQ04_9ROSI|nr:Drug/metabolite transporter [Corchorus olitorius]
MALFSKAAIAKGMNPYVFVVYRQAFATVALAPFAFFLERLTLSLNLYYIAINYTTATFAAATTNTIPVLTFIIAVCLSCIQSTVWAIAVERNPSAWKLGWDVHLLSVAYCGVIVTGITYWLQVWTIEKKGPVFTSIFTPFALVITAIFSVFLWRETLYWGSFGGVVLLVGGLYSVLWGKNREERKRVTNEQNQDSPKEEQIVLECITHH